MSFWLSVFSVKRENGTGMNAFSWPAVSTPFARRRAATTLLVPTSRPMGAPTLSSSSILSSTSWATFQRWSLRSSAMSYPPLDWD